MACCRKLTLGLLLCGVLAALAPARIWLIPDDAPTIQEGLNRCSRDDTVLVRPGIYRENIIWPSIAGIDLIGELGPDSTVIDGGSDGRVVEMAVNAVEPDTRVVGFTIQHGRAALGGGVYCDLSDPVIADCVIRDNVAAGTAARGGAVFCSNSAATVHGCLIFGNSAKGDSARGGAFGLRQSAAAVILNNNIFANTAGGGGGGISCESSNPLIMSNELTNDTSYHDGGAIFCMNSSPDIVRNTIIANWTQGGGGGVFCDSQSNPRIERNTISENVSVNCGGGGILCGGQSRALIIRNNITANTGDDGGGICLYAGSPATIEGNLIAWNQAGWVGGGICCDFHSDAGITNNLVLGNRATYRGGGIYCGDVQAVIANCDVVSNSCDSLGGGMYVDNTSFPVLFNSVFWDNAALVEGDDVYLRSLIPQNDLCSLYVDFTLIDSSRCAVKPGTGTIIWGNRILTTDPLFADSLLHLAPNSPCIDTGAESVFVAARETTFRAPALDLDSNPRPRGSGWDLGAYESPLGAIADRADIGTSVSDRIQLVCYPSPNRANIAIGVRVRTPSDAAVTIHSLDGRVVARVYDGPLGPGFREFRLDVRRVPAGTYFVRLRTADGSRTRRCLLVE